MTIGSGVHPGAIPFSPSFPLPAETGGGINHETGAKSDRLVNKEPAMFHPALKHGVKLVEQTTAGSAATHAQDADQQSA